MVSLTENEARTLEFLLRNFSQQYNINQLAKELGISPGGMFKILKKLENQHFLIEKKVGNNSLYVINYLSSDAFDACTFALTEKKVTPYISVWIKDLEMLKGKTQLAILFGSVLTKGKEARDIDLLLVFDTKNLKSVEALLERINRIKSKKVHALYQTRSDLIKNIKK